MAGTAIPQHNRIKQAQPTTNDNDTTMEIRGNQRAQLQRRVQPTPMKRLGAHQHTAAAVWTAAGTGLPAGTAWECVDSSPMRADNETAARTAAVAGHPGGYSQGMRAQHPSIAPAASRAAPTPAWGRPGEHTQECVYSNPTAANQSTIQQETTPKPGELK